MSPLQPPSWTILRGAVEMIAGGETHCVAIRFLSLRAASTPTRQGLNRRQAFGRLRPARPARRACQRQCVQAAPPAHQPVEQRQRVRRAGPDGDQADVLCDDTVGGGGNTHRPVLHLHRLRRRARLRCRRELRHVRARLDHDLCRLWLPHDVLAAVQPCGDLPQFDSGAPRHITDTHGRVQSSDPTFSRCDSPLPPDPAPASNRSRPPAAPAPRRAYSPWSSCWRAY